jgi:hypothetical protein
MNEAICHFAYRQRLRCHFRGSVPLGTSALYAASNFSSTQGAPSLFSAVLQTLRTPCLRSRRPLVTILTESIHASWNSHATSLSGATVLMDGLVYQGQNAISKPANGRELKSFQCAIPSPSVNDQSCRCNIMLRTTLRRKDTTRRLLEAQAVSRRSKDHFPCSSQTINAHQFHF